MRRSCNGPDCTTSRVTSRHEPRPVGTIQQPSVGGWTSEVVSIHLPGILFIGVIATEVPILVNQSSAPSSQSSQRPTRSPAPTQKGFFGIGKGSPMQTGAYAGALIKDSRNVLLEPFLL